MRDPSDPALQAVMPAPSSNAAMERFTVGSPHARRRALHKNAARDSSAADAAMADITETSRRG